MASCTYAPHRDILPPTQVKLVEPVVIGPRLGITDATPGGRQLEFREPRVTGGLNVAVAPLQDAFSHHFTTPSPLDPLVAYFTYHSMRCQTPKVTAVALTFGTSRREPEGNSV